MPDLSVIIPGKNEQFHTRTVEDVLANIRGDTEVIAICDGYDPDPPIPIHPKVRVIRTDGIGQRAATNLGARASSARFLLKLDAHCAVDEGFDVKLMADFQPGWTLIPAMHNLHAFDWVCQDCCQHVYQGSRPRQCEECGSSDLAMQMIWLPRPKCVTTSWAFDRNLEFQYWPERERIRGDVIETMSFIGACMFLERERYWELGGLDEGHGSYGQFGTEIACKTWLSGGQLMTTRRTWFAHMFRCSNFNRNGESSWPYKITQKEIDFARRYSRDIWLNNRWPLAKYPLQWLVEKFSPPCWGYTD